MIKKYKFIKGICFEDVPFWDMVYTTAEKIYYLPFILYYYDISRSGNIMSSKDRKLFDVFKVFNYSRKILTNAGLFDKLKYIVYAHATCNMVLHLKNINKDLRKDFINEIKNFKIDVSVEQFLQENFFKFEYDNFKLIKFIQENDYNSVITHLEKIKFF